MTNLSRVGNISVVYPLCSGSCWCNWIILLFKHNNNIFYNNTKHHIVFNIHIYYSFRHRLETQTMTDQVAIRCIGLILLPNALFSVLSTHFTNGTNHLCQMICNVRKCSKCSKCSNLKWYLRYMYHYGKPNGNVNLNVWWICRSRCSKVQSLF